MCRGSPIVEGKEGGDAHVDDERSHEAEASLWDISEEVSAG